MNLDQQLREADKRVQSLIDDKRDRLMIRNRFTWEHARRASAQRLRNDKREQKAWKSN